MTLSADVAATLQPGFPGPDGPGWLVRAHAEGLVSVCLYGDNVAGPDGLATLCRTLLDRMPGVLLAVRRVASTPGFTIGLDALLAP